MVWRARQTIKRASGRAFCLLFGLSLAVEPAEPLLWAAEANVIGPLLIEPA